MKIWKTVLAGILSVSMGISVPLEANAARYKKFRYTPAFEKISAETAKLGVSYKKVLEKATSVIEKNEASSVSYIENKRGTVSVGLMKWKGEEARKLLQYAVSLQNKQAYSLLGSRLYNEIILDRSWKNRTFSKTEIGQIKKLLTSSSGRQAQKRWEQSDMTGLLNAAVKSGITNASAIVYYMDISVQAGTGHAQKVLKTARKIVGSYKKVTLNTMLESAMVYPKTMTYYKRRFSTYKSIRKTGWIYKASGQLQIADQNSTKNNTKEGIRWIQTNLNTIASKTGAFQKIKVTGINDAATKKAVYSFQKAASLSADGDAGYKTSAKIIYVYYMAFLNGTSIKQYLKLPKSSSGSKEKTPVISTYKQFYKVKEKTPSFDLNAKSTFSTPELFFFSSDLKVAKVDKTGIVTPVGAGTAKITILQPAGNKTTAVCKVITVVVEK